MDFKLKILSPIHIGSGREYKTINYIYNEDYIKIFDEDDVIKSISDPRKLDNELMRTMSFSGNKSYYHKGLDHFINKGVIDKKILKKVRIQAENRTIDIKGKDIKAFTRELGRAYIPGSTLKGYIRTAILYDYIKSKGIDFVKSAIKEIDDRSKRKVRTIENVMFYNISVDAFRFLIIRDIDVSKEDIVIYEEQIYNTNTFFSGDIIETVSEKTETKKSSIEIQLMVEKSRSAGASIYNKLGMNKDITKYFTYENILDCLYKYSKDLIEDEINYYNKNRNKYLNTEAILNFLEDCREKNTKANPVIRLGKSTGFNSHTMGVLIKNMDKNFYDREFVKFVKPHKWDKSCEFPKSRKIIGPTINPKILGFAQILKDE